MKQLLLALTFITSMNSLAAIESLRVSEFYCGEVDPYVLGDVCVLMGTSKKRRYGLKIDFDTYSQFEGEIKSGDILSLNTHYLNSITLTHLSEEELSVYNEVFGGFIRNLYEVSFPGAIISVKKNKMTSEYKLSCVNSNFFMTGFLYGKIKIEAKLSLFELGTFSLSNIKLNYTLSTDQNHTSGWAKGEYSESFYELENMYNYNPRVYINHIKFPGIYSHKGFGEIDLIMPKTKLNKITLNQSFNSVVILTSIDDHAGGVTGLKCSMTSILK